MPPNTGNDLTFSNEHDLENDVTTKNIKINGRPKKWYEFETEVIWKNSIFMIGLHLICLYYTITFPYLEQKFLSVWGNYLFHLFQLIFYYITHTIKIVITINYYITSLAFIMLHLTGIGVTAGVHRLWTHRAYKAKTPLRIILATLYYSAGQVSLQINKNSFKEKKIIFANKFLNRVTEQNFQLGQRPQSSS